MINYFVMFFGIAIVLISIIAIFIDKVKGEDIYFNLDFKEQELKKVIEDADEIITELNYTSDTIVKDLEDKINYINSVINNSIIDFENDLILDEQNKNNKNRKVVNNTSVSKKYTFKGKNEFKFQNHEKAVLDKNSLVLKYYNEGYSIAEIAQKMEIGKGEVQLITSLRNEGKRDG